MRKWVVWQVHVYLQPVVGKAPGEDGGSGLDAGSVIVCRIVGTHTADVAPGPRVCHVMHCSPYLPYVLTLDASGKLDVWADVAATNHVQHVCSTVPAMGDQPADGTNPHHVAPHVVAAAASPSL